MKGMLGMDIAQVRALSPEIRGRAGEVVGVVDRLSGALEAVDWAGDDRDRFLREWLDVHAPALRALASSMQAAARDAANSATAQEHAAGLA